MGELPVSEGKKDALDDARVVSILKDQLAKVPTDEQIDSAYAELKEGHSDLIDPIGDWMTVVHEVATDAVRRIEAKEGVEDLLERVNRMIELYHHGKYDVDKLKDAIDAGKKLSEAIIAALESSPPEHEQAA